MALLNMSNTGLAILAVLVSLLVRFFSRLNRQRRLLKGLPSAPHGYLLGNLVAMAKVAMKNPPNVAGQVLLPELQKAYNLPDVFYFDPWPLSDPVMTITNSELLDQITSQDNPLKHPVTRDFMEAFGGKYNLVSAEGAQWKKWRSVFNPGFSHKHLLTQLRVIVEESLIFHDKMTRKAQNNELFRLETHATRLTINIIGRIVLDHDLNAQLGENPLVSAFESQTQWQYVGANLKPSELWDIRRPIMIRYNNWKMSKYIRTQLRARAAAPVKSKHTIDLALEAYHKEVSRSATQGELDPTFELAAIANIKTFLFAGHDTTSSTICYALYYLSQYPETLSAIRAEIDSVFGTTTPISTQLLTSPHLLDSLPYTLAVTKETLRLQPPANTARAGSASLILHHPETGAALPTENFMIFPVTCGLHRNPRYWPDPDVFNPDRFLPGSASYEMNNRQAFTPFSKGTRNCIGQDLALIETKVILAMMVRDFDFVPAYEEVGKLRGDATGYPSLTSGVLTQNGERAYQIQRGTAKPAEGMPCRMVVRRHAGRERERHGDS